MLEPDMKFPKLTTVRAERIGPGVVVWGWEKPDNHEEFTLFSEGVKSKNGATDSASDHYVWIEGDAMPRDTLVLVEA